MLDAVARRIDAPLHLVAHSLGGRYADDRVGQRCGYQKHRNLRGQPGFFLRDRGATYEEMLAVSDNFEAGERNAARQIIDY